MELWVGTVLSFQKHLPSLFLREKKEKRKKKKQIKTWNFFIVFFFLNEEEHYLPVASSLDLILESQAWAQRSTNQGEGS